MTFCSLDCAVFLECPNAQSPSVLAGVVNPSARTEAANVAKEI